MPTSPDALTRQWLDHWHALLGDPSIPAFSSPDAMAGVLADFRRDPRRLEQAFAPLPQGEELLARVRRCIANEPDPGGLYLVVQPMAASDTELRKLVLEALKRGCGVCGIDLPTYEVKVHRRRMSSGEMMASAPLIEELGDHFIDLSFGQANAQGAAMKFLWETLYTLAASFSVRGYCLTPLCPEAERRVDPWAPQLELWLRGAQAVVRWAEDVDMWVDVFVAPAHELRT